MLKLMDMYLLIYSSTKINLILKNAASFVKYLYAIKMHLIVINQFQSLLFLRLFFNSVPPLVIILVNRKDTLGSQQMINSVSGVTKKLLSECLKCV